jgi:CheY-like chemotaxis protein
VGFCDDSNSADPLGHVLMVDDNHNDTELTRLAFQQAKITNPLKIMWTAEDAMAYFDAVVESANGEKEPLPDLILLDLKMPKVDGFEFLAWLKSKPELSKIPVVVLTSSDHQRDVNQAYTLGANSFLVKPFDFAEHVRLAKTVRDFWLVQNKLPSKVHRKPDTNGTERFRP